MSLKDYLKLIIPIVLLYILFHLVHIGCPIRFLTGIPCAGCGMTRAWYQVLMLHFDKAFYYHPLFWFVPSFILFFMIFQKGALSQKKFNYFITMIALIFTIVYIYRLLNPINTIVKIDLSDGAIARWLKTLAEGRE